MDAALGEASHPLKRFLTSRAGSLLFFALVTLLVFHRALINEYAYDGAEVMLRISTPAPVPLSVLWQPTVYGEATGFMSWRPLALAIHILVDRDLFGANAALSHALNLALHAASGWLLFILARAIGMRNAAAFFAALLFLVHPLTTEVVLCAEFRFDTLALMFALLSVLFALSACEREKFHAGLLAASAMALMLGLASKENAIIALPIAALVIFLQTRNVRGATIAFVALLATAIAFFAVWSLFRAPNYGAGYLGGEGRALGFGNFLVAFREIYFRKFLFPWPLRIDYEFQAATSYSDHRIVWSMLIAGLLVFAAIIGAWWRKNILIGAACIACGFAPVAQLTPVPDPIAERFCYIPLAGAALIAADIFALIVYSGGRGRPPSTNPRWIKLVASLSAILFLAALAGLSWRRSLDWRDDVTLNITNWEQPGEKSAKARLTLGALYLTRAARAKDARDESAADEWSRQAEMNLVPLLESAAPAPPAEALRLLGVLALMQGDKDGARDFAARALRQEPENPQVQKLAAATGLLSAQK